MAAAIDFGTSKIVTLVGEGGGGKPCDILGVGNATYAGFVRGYWNEPDALTDAIRRSTLEAEAQSHRKVEEVYVGLPGEVVRVVLNEVALEMKSPNRRITADDVSQIMAAAEECQIPSGGEIIHRSPAWFCVDQQQTMEPIGLRGGMLSCMVSFVVADVGFMGEISDRLQELGITVKGFLSSSLGEALMLVMPEERDSMAIMLDVGYLTSEIMAIKGDALVYHEVLSLGGGHITAELAYELELTMSMAEQIKRKYAFGAAFSGETIDVTDDDGRALRFTRQQVQGIIEPRVNELCEMVREIVAESDLKVPPKANVYLTGGGLAMMRGSREYMSAILNLPVKSPAARSPKLNTPSLSSSLGLMDLCFETLENEAEVSQSAISRALGAVKAMFTRS